jgi:diaminohydroxyphosphoribosylaminopyrimidine deaminase/5-amino-6-(5-phosphoribosylamino)uracil reductase
LPRRAFPAIIPGNTEPQIVQDFSPQDVAFMRRALKLAERGRGFVEPNPMVGCVIVRDGRIVGEGLHRRFGGPHAEVEALRRAGSRARDATVYVNLEPCCHFGKTPPCTNALRAARVRRLVAATRDPNPVVRSRGIAALRSAGMEVRVGLLRDEAMSLNAPFFKLATQRRPWVIAKWAQSLDGKIATRTGDSKWISDQTARAHAHRVRGRMDAIIVGIGTVLSDDPMLTCRAVRPRRVAARIVLDARLRIPLSATLVRTARRIPTWVLTTAAAPSRGRRALLAAGCVVEDIASTGGKLRLTAVLNLLGKHDMANVLVEGGGQLLGSFADQGLIDEIHAYIAPKLVGGADAIGALCGRGVARVADAARLNSMSCRSLGDGLLVTARLQAE